MEPQNALHMLVLPVIWWVGGEVAFLVLIRLIYLGIVRLVAGSAGRHRILTPPALAGPHRISPIRGDRGPARFVGLAR